MGLSPKCRGWTHTIMARKYCATSSTSFTIIIFNLYVQYALRNAHFLHLSFHCLIYTQQSPTQNYQMIIMQSSEYSTSKTKPPDNKNQNYGKKLFTAHDHFLLYYFSIEKTVLVILRTAARKRPQI